MNNIESAKRITFTLNFGMLIGFLKISITYSDDNIVSEVEIQFLDDARTDYDISIDNNKLQNISYTNKENFKSLLEKVKLDKWKSDYWDKDIAYTDGNSWELIIEFDDEKDCILSCGSDVFPNTIIEFLAFFNIDFNKLAKDFEFELVDV